MPCCGEGRKLHSRILSVIRPSSASIKYVITLDTDTQLPRDTARTLIGNIAHPLNRPVYDADKGRIVEGYAILQPRASISLTSAGQSRFTKLFAGESGIDPYTREVSDVYQDIFGEGSFIGKGIYDVDAFRQAVDGRFPENLILSHDLLESGYARSALVTDVDLIEEHPASYAIEASRRHRWIRGDWQLAGWLLPRVPGPPRLNEPNGPNGSKAKRQPNPLTALSVWKIFDNLRRSLVPPSLLALLAGGWLFGPGPAWFWTLLVAGVVFLPTLLGTVIELIRKPEERDWLVHLMPDQQIRGPPNSARFADVGPFALRRADLPGCDPALGCAHAVHSTRIVALATALLCKSQRAPYVGRFFYGDVDRAGSGGGAGLRVGGQPVVGVAVLCARLVALAGVASRRLVDQQAACVPRTGLDR